MVPVQATFHHSPATSNLFDNPDWFEALLFVLKELRHGLCILKNLA